MKYTNYWGSSIFNEVKNNLTMKDCLIRGEFIEDIEDGYIATFYVNDSYIAESLENKSIRKIVEEITLDWFVNINVEVKYI